MVTTTETAGRGEVRGRISLFDIAVPRLQTDPAGVFHRYSQRNQLQVEWGQIAARCIGRGDRDYRISAMYVEFENVAAPGDPVTAPSYAATEGRDYYEDLAMSSDRDFLRIPLSLSPGISVATGYADYFPNEADAGNMATFFAQTQGVAGVHGKPFTEAANSTIFGLALVAAPLFTDRTKDLVMARTYLPVDEQVPKQGLRQTGVVWDIEFIL